MAGYGQRTFLYKIPFSDWDEDEYENAYEQLQEEETDPPPSWGIGINVHFLEDIGYGDPEGIALSYVFGTVLNLHHTDYRVGRVLGGGYYWSSGFSGATAGSNQIVSIKNNTFLSALEIAYQEEGFSHVDELVRPLMNYENAFSREIVNQLIGLAKIYGEMTNLDVVFFDKWIDEKYPDSKGIKIGEITIETLSDHEAKIFEFFSSKLSIITENKWLEDFTTDKSGKEERAAKLEYLKDRVNDVPEELINELLKETGIQMGDTIWSFLKGLVLGWGDVIATGNPIATSAVKQVAIDELEKLKTINEKFEEKGVSISEVFEFIGVFREIAIAEAFDMLAISKDVLAEEKERYSDSEEVDKLYSFIHKSYTPKFWEANKLRAQAAISFINWVNNSNVFAYSRTSLAFKIQNNKNNLEKVAGIISVVEPRELIASLAPLLERKRFFDNPLESIKNSFDTKLMVIGNYKMVNNMAEVYKIDPSFRTADKMDMSTISSIYTEGAASFPILSDISFDFRRLFTYKQADFGSKIQEQLKEKIKNNEDVHDKLMNDPETVWKLELLIDKVRSDYGISIDSIAGRVINDYQSDKKNAEFWQNMGMAALGIALGIAGFFTGGFTWAGLAFIGAGVALSSYEIYQAVDDYQFRDAARDTSLNDAMELSEQEPSALPIIMGIFGLVLDVGGLLKALKVFRAAPHISGASGVIEGYDTSFLKTVDDNLNNLLKESSDSDKIREAAKKIYEVLGKGRLKGSPDFETFLQSVEEVIEKHKLYESFNRELNFIFKNADIDKVFTTGLLEGLPGLGLKRIYELDKAVAKRMIESFADNPKALYQFTVESAFNKQFADSLSQIGSKISSKELFHKTLSYLTNNRRTGLPTLEETLRHIDAGKIIDEKLVSEIITNPNLRITLKNMDNPENLNGLWKQFQKDKPRSSFSEYAKSKANFRQNQTISSRYTNFSKLTTREKNLTLIGDTEPHLADLLKNGKLLPDNSQLKKAVTELLEKELIGNTTILSSARGKVISKLNEVIGSNIRNVDEFKEVMKIIEQPGSRGSIGEYYAFSKKLLGSAESQISRHLSIDVSQLGLKNPQKFNPDELIFNKQSGKFGEIKSGYPTGGVDLDQVDNYVTIFQNRFKPEYADLFKQLGVEPQNFKGVDYLVLPGKGGEDTFKAAMETYLKIIDRPGTREMFENGNFVIKYLSDENIIKTFNL